jgi:CheY-like chemotaxis protein
MNHVSDPASEEHRTARPEKRPTGEGAPITGPPAFPDSIPIPASRPPRALIVENDLTNRELLARVLRAKGLRAETAIGAAQAAAILADAAPNEFDLLIVDLNLEPIDGVEFLRDVASLPADHRPPTIVAIADSLGAFYPRLADIRIRVETFQKPVHLPSLMKVVEK